MRTTLNSLFGEGCDCVGGPLRQAIDDGYVRTQSHPTLPLTIFNYTDKAVYDRAWNNVTLTCRGLIAYADGTVLARPFRKFFNYGETPASLSAVYDKAVVTDKMDGSLGILYPTPDGYAIATRGSFASEQALHATEVWRSRYAGTFEVDPEFTLLFEIVYPDNRIVLDYDEFDDLILLGAVHIETGLSVADISQIVWPGPRTTVFPYASLAEALAVPPRPNAEGFVVHLVDKDDRIKVKQEDYVRLHRILTGLTARTVWEHLLTGQPLVDLITPLPDEFHDWVANVAAGITVGVQMQSARILQVYAEILGMMPAGFSRKDFAVYAGPHPDKWALFRLLDGQEIGSELLKRAKPEPFLTPTGRTYGEDTA